MKLRSVAKGDTMTDKEFIEMWNKVTREEMGDCEKMQTELATCCNFCLELSNTGLCIPWKDFPESYRRTMMTALLLRLTGKKPRDIINEIKNIGRIDTCGKP